MTLIPYPTSARAIAMGFALVAAAGCGSNDSSTADVGEQWLNEHARAEPAQTNDVVSLRSSVAQGLGPGEYLLLDAAPQCDLSRLGVPASASDLGVHAEARRVIAAGALARAPMALCACGEFEASNHLAAAGAARIDGPVGVNDEFLGNAPIQIAGALVAPGAVRVGNSFEAAELSTNGTLSASTQVTIHGNAEAGWLSLPGNQLRVEGSLTVPTGTDLSAVESAATIAYATPNVAAPCDCGADVDYDALRTEIHDGAQRDDPRETATVENALSGLDRAREIYLARGRYYFSAIESSAALTVHTSGRVQIFVDGDLIVAGDLRVVPEKDSQVSLYVAGCFAPSAGVSLAEGAKPDALRLYVRDQVHLSGPVQLNGSLFAPRASFIADGSVETTGALFASSFDLNGALSIKPGPRFTGDACLVWNELDGRSDETPATATDI